MNEKNRLSNNVFNQYNALADYLKKVEDITRPFDAVSSAFTQCGAIDNMGKGLDDAIKPVNSVSSAFALNNAMANMVKGLDDAIRPVNSVSSAFALNNAMANMLKGIEAATRPLNTISSALALNNTMADMFKRVEATTRPFEIDLTNLLNISDAVMQLSLDQFTASTAIEFTSSTTFEIDSTQQYCKSDIDDIERRLLNIFSPQFVDIQETLKAITNELKSLKKPFIQRALLFFIQLFLTILITPFIQQPFEKLIKEHANKTVIQPPTVATRIHLSPFRIITCPYLIAREHPSAKSMRIATLQKGQIIELLYKSSKWALIQWNDENSNTHIQGWVHSKYLKRIR